MMEFQWKDMKTNKTLNAFPTIRRRDDGYKEKIETTGKGSEGFRPGCYRVCPLLWDQFDVFIRQIVLGDGESRGSRSSSVATWPDVGRGLESRTCRVCWSRMIDVPVVSSTVRRRFGRCWLRKVDDSPSGDVCSWIDPLLRVSFASSWLLHHRHCNVDKIRPIIVLKRTVELKT